MDMATCVARRTRSRTESYLNSILNKSKGITGEDQCEGSLNSRTEKRRGVSMRYACSPSPRKTKRRRRKVSEEEDDDDVEFVRADYPEGKREDEHVVDDDNVGSNSVILDSKSLDCGDRVCDFDLDDVNLRGEEKTSNFNALSPDDDDVVFVGTIPGENEHVGDGNVGSGVCDILLDDVNLKGEEKISESDEVVSLSLNSSSDEEGSVEELGTDSGEEVSGQDRDPGESDSDDEDANSDSSDYVGESSDSSDVDSSDSDFVCSEDEDGGARDVAKDKKNPSEKLYYHKKSRTFCRENNLDVFNLLAKSIWESTDIFDEDICSGDKIAEVDSREDAIIRESSSEKVNKQGKPREPRSVHRVKEKNHLKGKSFVGGEKICDGQETIHCSAEDSPPLNLRFGCEEPVLIEKTEEEKEIDSLWEDMAVALTMEGMHSSTPAKVRHA